MRNNFDVSTIFYESQLEVRIAQTGLMKKDILGVGRNHVTSGSKSSHAESSWCSNESTEGTILIELGSLLPN